MPASLLAPESAANQWDEDPELYREVLATFGDELEERFAVLEADAARDTALLAHEVHSLKSAAGNVGAVRLQSLAVELDALCKEQRYGEATRRLPDLLAIMTETMGAVRDRTGERAS